MRSSAIRSCFRVLVGRAVANGLLDPIIRFFPIGVIEHIFRSFWEWREIRPILSGIEQNKRGPLTSVDQLQAATGFGPVTLFAQCIIHLLYRSNEVRTCSGVKNEDRHCG